MNRSTDNLIKEHIVRKSYGSKSKAPTSSKTTRISIPVDYGNSHTSPYNGSAATSEISINCQAEINKLCREQKATVEGDTICYTCRRRLGKGMKYFTGTLLWFLVFAGTLILPLVAVIIGSVFINDCPRDYRVPLFLIVGGSTAVFSNLLNLIHRCVLKRNWPSGETQHDQDSCPLPSKVVGVMTSVLHCFAIVWFFTGCVWVYQAYPEEGAAYCQPAVYFLAFWLLNACFIIFLVVFVTCLVRYVVSSLRLD